jgi:hypothetical protein
LFREVCLKDSFEELLVLDQLMGKKFSEKISTFVIRMMNDHYTQSEKKSIYCDEFSELFNKNDF